MPAHLDTMAKTPFVLDTRPLSEATSAHAGLLATSRAFRSLGFPSLIDSHLKLYRRKRGFSEAQMIESVVLLQTLGGDCPEDINLLCGRPVPCAWLRPNFSIFRPRFLRLTSLPVTG